MAAKHPAPGEVIDVRGPADPSGRPESEMLVRTDHLEVFRYVLPAGKTVDTHTAAGIMVLHCLEGAVDVSALGGTRRLTAGTMLYLQDGEPHGVNALADTLLVVTILLHRA